jgi:hypothetical protein
MPRRRVLTDAQVASLVALPVDEPPLVRHWTLDDVDLAAIERRHGEHNQFGFALPLWRFDRASARPRRPRLPPQPQP